MNNEILYLMHVPWNWIKQRPHFIAENLSHFYKVKVFCKYNYRSKNLVHNPIDGNIQMIVGFVIPLARFNIVQKINAWILKLQLARLVKASRIVWITDPFYYETVVALLRPDHFLVFDCMDDTRSFPLVATNADLRSRLIDLEGRLCRRSNLIIASSENLKGKLVARYEVDPGKVKIVNNAANIQTHPAPLPLPVTVTPSDPNAPKKIVYIGTISEWFDFDLLVEALSKVASVEFHLFGPIEIQAPVHPAIKLWGPVPHSKVFSLMEGCDALVMPFLPTELIMSVNPVKLYEYIYSGKPVIALNYPESLPFQDFVSLYSSREAFIDLIAQVASGELSPKKSLKQCQEFILKNTWEARIQEIRSLLPIS